MKENTPIINLLNSFNPSESALLDWLEPHIDDTILDDIANADYGWHREENFKALKLIHDSQQIPIPIPWVPLEVLNLSRWTEPDAPQEEGWPPKSKGKRGHLLRAFCCAVLLKAADEQETRVYVHSENETVIQLVSSVLHLGNKASECALRLLCWRVLRQSYIENEAPFFALSVLLLSAALHQPNQDGSGLKLLADWVISEEKRVRMEDGIFPESESWLLGLVCYDLRHEVWRKVAQEILLDPTKSFRDPAATAMRHIAELLAPEQG